MKVLVTGGRDFSDAGVVFKCLDYLHTTRGVSLVIQGGAKGADSLSKDWCESRGVHSCQVDALWDFYKKGAGHRRNATMLQLSPDGCVAFKGGRGTLGMIGMCDKTGVKVWKVGWEV